MYRRVIFLFGYILAIINTTTRGQENQFQTTLSSLASEIQTVQNSKKTFTQSVNSDNPGVLKLNVTETDKKGNTKEYLFEFNVADIDVNTIKPVTSKDVIEVQLIVDKNQKLIKEVVDNEKISYLNKVMVLALDIDNARKLTDIFKALVPISESITENRLSLTSYEDRLQWLTENISNVNLIDKTYNQTFTSSKTLAGNVTLISSEANDETIEYNFNLSNINPNTLFFKSNGSEFILKIEMQRRLKMIKVIEGGQQENYTYKFDLQCRSVENARELQKVFQDIIPLAEEHFKNSFMEVATPEQGLGAINDKIGTIVNEDETTQQSFTQKCVPTLTIINEGSKKKEDFIYDFNLIDINKEDINLEIKSKEVFLELNTIAKNRFIKLIKNNELQNFTNDINIKFNGIEDALYAQHILKEAIGQCETIYQNKPKIKDLKTGLSTLISNLKSVSLDKNTIEQKLEITDKESKNIPLRFTEIIVSDKKSDENIQEFNLTDINPKSVEIKVSGKKIMVEFNTNYQEKIIKTYKNGDIKAYTNQVSLNADTVENARELKSLLVQIIAKIEG